MIFLRGDRNRRLELARAGAHRRYHLPFKPKANAKITTQMSRLRRILAEGSDQFFAQGFGNRFGFGMNLEFLVDVFQVKGDGMKRDAERMCGSFFVMSFD